MGSWIIKVLDRPSQCWYHCLFLAPASLFISLFYLISRHISQFWSSWVMTYAKNDGWHGCIIIFLSPRGNFSHIYYLSDKSLSLKRKQASDSLAYSEKKIKQAVIVYMTNKSRALNANPSTRRILRSRHYLELLWNLAVFPFLPLNRGCIFLPALNHQVRTLWGTTALVWPWGLLCASIHMIIIKPRLKDQMARPWHGVENPVHFQLT
jgi:hypothetical protein